MLISTAIMLSLWIMGFGTLPLLGVSIFNKSSVKAKVLIALAVFIPLYALGLAYLADALCVDLPLAIIIFYPFAIGFAIVDLIAIIVNCVKMKKLEKGGPVAKTIVIGLIIALTPVVFMAAVCIRQVICLNTSYLVINCHSRGNGGIGDSASFIYAYDGKTFHLLDMGSAYQLYKFLPSNMVKSDDGKTAGNYYISEGDDSLFIRLGDDLVIEKGYEPGYFNVSVEEVYYRTHS